MSIRGDHIFPRQIGFIADPPCGFYYAKRFGRFRIKLESFDSGA
jgi:hypothetical protein